MQLSVNQRIKKFRESLSLTQEVFAKEIGVSRATIAQIEAEKQQPTVDQLSKMSLRWGVSIDMLVTGRDAVSLSKFLASEDSPGYVSSREKSDAYRENQQPMTIMVDYSSVKLLEDRVGELEKRVSELEG